MPKLRTRPPSQEDISRVGQSVDEAVSRYREGRFDETEKICGRLLKAWPDLFEAHHLVGLARLASGRPGAALGHLERAVALNPKSSHAASSLAMALAALNRDADALSHADRAVALAPDNVEAINNRGNVLMKLNRPAEALSAFRRATTIEPRFLAARLNRGNALAALGREADALAQYDEVLTAAPEHVDAYVNRATALLSLGRPAEAIESFDRVLASRPRDVRALIARGSALHALNRNREALESYAQAIAIDKENADAHHNTALSLLTLGDCRRGFEEFEWRWRRSGMSARRRSLGKPLWLGEYPLPRKTILLHAEQGLGDTIQFARYAPLVARAGGNVVLEVASELRALLSRIPGVASVHARGEPLPAYDVHCPLASLAHALHTEATTIPADVPYLTASPERLAKWRARLQDIAAPRIAIAWAGSASHPNDRNRSIAPEALEPLLARAPARLISVQRDLRGSDADLLARTPGLAAIGAELEDFEDTAAVLSLVDLVITVDTAVAHLAGALARPTWVMLPFCPDWRWMIEREDSPWYPTARLYRQPVPGDWPSVLARIETDLASAEL
jgi:tetratricopeptide (TPR) repeat protein